MPCPIKCAAPAVLIAFADAVVEAVPEAVVATYNFSSKSSGRLSRMKCDSPDEPVAGIDDVPVVAIDPEAELITLPDDMLIVDEPTVAAPVLAGAAVLEAPPEQVAAVGTLTLALDLTRSQYGVLLTHPGVSGSRGFMKRCID